jgi:hypothetical protein
MKIDSRLGAYGDMNTWTKGKELKGGPPSLVSAPLSLNDCMHQPKAENAFRALFSSIIQRGAAAAGVMATLATLACLI